MKKFSLETSPAVKSDKYSGFFKVPYFSRYVVSVDGEVIDTLRNSVIPTYTSPSGYLLLSMLGDDKVRRIVRHHRMMGITFLKRPKNWRNLPINHLDGNKVNNHPSNIEWCTQSENVLHSVKNKLSERFNIDLNIEVKNCLTGEINRFYNLKPLSKYLNKPTSEVNTYIKKGMRKVFAYKFLLREISDNPVPWYEFTEDDITPKTKKHRSVGVYNIHTGDAYEFGTITAAAIYTKTSRDTVIWRCNRKEQIVYDNGFAYRYTDNGSVWREFDIPEKELGREGNTQKVLLRNLKTGTVRRFNSQTELAAHLNVEPVLITNWLKQAGQLVKYGPYQVKDAFDETPWREVVNWEHDLLKSNAAFKAVLITDKNGKRLIYKNIKEAGIAYGVKHTSAHWRVSNSYTDSDGNKWEYL